MKDAFLTTAILGSTTAPPPPPPPPPQPTTCTRLRVGLRRRIRRQHQHQVHHPHLISHHPPPPQPLTTVHLNYSKSTKSKREIISLSSFLSVLKTYPLLLLPPHHLLIQLQLIPKILHSQLSLTPRLFILLFLSTTQFAAAAAAAGAGAGAGAGAVEDSSLTSLLDASSSAAAAAHVNNKIWVESVVVGIDDFLNRYPFFVSTLTFIWLVALPLTRYYFFSNYKYVSALQAFQKLRDQPNCVLLDIRRKKIVDAFPSPNLKLLNNKKCLRVEYLYSEDEEQQQQQQQQQDDGRGQLGGGARNSLNNDNNIFIQRVKGELVTGGDPSTTILCIIDSFDGNSLKVAQLLSESGFKEAYAIKGGIQGKNGWQEIQEELLPSSLHVYPRRKRSFMPSNTSKQAAAGITNENVGAATSQKEEGSDLVKDATDLLEASPLEK